MTQKKRAGSRLCDSALPDGKGLCLTSTLALERSTFGLFGTVGFSTGDPDVISGAGVILIIRAVACCTVYLNSGIGGEGGVGHAAVSLAEAGTISAGFCLCL